MRCLYHLLFLSGGFFLREHLVVYLYPMKTALYILIFGYALSACNHPDMELKARIAGSDSMAINYFKGDGTMDTVVAVRIIRDKQKIEQLAAFIAGQSVAGNYTCGYDGSLHFFKMNSVIQDIDFRMNTGGCMYFYFLQHGKSQATVLAEEAKELIISFRNNPG